VEDVMTLTQANPRLFYVDSGDNPFDSGTLNAALNIKDIKFVTGYSPFTSASFEGLVVLSGVSAKDAAGKNIASADSRAYLASVNLAPASPAFSDRFTPFRDQVNAVGGTGMTAYPQGVVLCFSEGTGGRVAAIGVGVSLDSAAPPQPRPTGNRLATELFLDDNASRFGCTP
jgi:hypothetical protein